MQKFWFVAITFAPTSHTLPQIHLVCNNCAIHSQPSFGPTGYLKSILIYTKGTDHVLLCFLALVVHVSHHLQAIWCLHCCAVENNSGMSLLIVIDKTMQHAL